MKKLMKKCEPYLAKSKYTSYNLIFESNLLTNENRTKEEKSFNSILYQNNFFKNKTHHYNVSCAIYSIITKHHYREY